MGYVSSRPTTPPRVAVIPRRNHFVDGPRDTLNARARSRASTRAGLSGYPTRVRLSGDQLGILPVIAAAAPSVTDLAKKAGMALVGIVDPGKKRDAERQARANMYRELAKQGSITAANRVYSASIGIHGGEGPTKEANWYKQAWSDIQATVPDIAAKVPSLPRVGLPDPQRPELSAADTSLIQNEINLYHGIASAAGSGAAAEVASAGASGNLGMILGLGVLGAFLVSRRR